MTRLQLSLYPVRFRAVPFETVVITAPLVPALFLILTWLPVTYTVSSTGEKAGAVSVVTAASWALVPACLPGLAASFFPFPVSASMETAAVSSPFSGVISPEASSSAGTSTGS